MRLRALLAAALTTGALLAMPATAAETELVISGRTSGWVELDESIRFGPQTPQISAHGRYGGFYVQQLSLDREGQGSVYDGGYVSIPGLSPDGAAAPMPLGSIPRIVEGRIRLYLIADGPTTVRIRTENLSGRHVRVTRRANVQFRMGPLAPAGDLLAGTLPLRVSPHDVTLASVHLTGTAAALSGVEVCVRPRDEACGQQPLLGTPQQSGGYSVADDQQRWTYTAQPGAHGGDAEASATVDPFLPVRRAVLAGFSLRTLANPRKPPA